jgi:hypothetical protein
MGDGLTKEIAVAGSAVHVIVMISPAAAVVPPLRVNSRAVLVDGMPSALRTVCSDTTVFWLKLTMLPSVCVGAALGECVGCVGPCVGTAVRHVHTGHDPARRRVKNAAVSYARRRRATGAFVGPWVGTCVGACVGDIDGAVLGAAVGACVGTCVGACVGECEGAALGAAVGACVGTCVGA